MNKNEEKVKIDIHRMVWFGILGFNVPLDTV